MQNHSVFKTCCFIGHRRIEFSEEKIKEIYEFIENLILNENVKIFLFGSKSEFDDLCHRVVTELKEKYPYIKRVGYTCRSEGVLLESEREKWKKIYSSLGNGKFPLLFVEEEFEYKAKYVSGRASYIERNQAMINDSDYCLFYYNKEYVPPQRKYSKRDIGYYQPNSGTAIAYEYAQRKKKIIKNFY